MPFFKMEMISLTLVLHWRTWNRSNVHCNYYNVSSFITFSQQLKYNWTISILNMVPLKLTKVLVTTLSWDESLILALVFRVKSLVSQGKSLVSRVKTLVHLSRGLKNCKHQRVFGKFMDLRMKVILCSAFLIMSCIRLLIHGVNFDERMWLSCTVLLEPFFMAKTALKLFKVSFFVL